MPKTSPIFSCIRLSLLVAILVSTVAFADDYTPVTTLLRSGQLDNAMAKANEYLVKNPRDPQMQFLRALILQDGGKQAEAIASYTKLIEAYPELPEPYNNIAVLYAAQGQYDRARSSLEMATRTSRSYGTAYENLGDVYARLATQSYIQAQQLEPGNTTIAPKLALIRQLISNPLSGRSAGPPDRTKPATPSASSAQ